MTSPAAASRPPVTPESLRTELEARIRSRHVAADPGAVAGIALTVVLPHLKGMAAEIERLRTELAAVRALAVTGGTKLADLERIRDAARAGKSGSEGEKR